MNVNNIHEHEYSVGLAGIEPLAHMRRVAAWLVLISGEALSCLWGVGSSVCQLALGARTLRTLARK
jgi:hypothetical protein